MAIEGLEQAYGPCFSLSRNNFPDCVNSPRPYGSYLRKIEMRQRILIICFIVGGFLSGRAQQKDSVKLLKEVNVTGYKTLNGIGHFLETKDGIIYAGKKTEIIIGTA